jgi:hypothetical protein
MQATITLGDTLSYTTALSDYPAISGWVLKTRLVPRSAGSPISLVSSPDSTDPSLHRTTAAAATTAAWTAGNYSFFTYVEKASEQYKIDEGQIKLAPDPRTATTLDNRSDAAKALEAVDAFLSGSTSPAVLSYRIGDREVQYFSSAELSDKRAQLVVQVKRENRAKLLSKGLADPSKSFVRMANA